MRCTTCGSDLAATMTDLPFRVTETAIIIVKGLPVMACELCPGYLIEDEPLSHLDQIMAGVGSSTELAVINFSA